MDFITNATQINNATDIIASLNKEETKKVFDYLVRWMIKQDKRDSDLNLLSQYQKDNAKYAAVVEST
jgi:phage terminase large subunit-like protein